MIGETIQIIEKILSEENSTEMSDDTADFKFKVQNQKAFVGNASETVFSTQSVVDDEEDTNKLTPQQIKAKLSNQNKLTKITQLCLFLFDCNSKSTLPETIKPSVPERADYWWHVILQSRILESDFAILV